MTNVLSWLEATAKRLPDKTAVADPETSLSFSELKSQAQHFGTWLAPQTTPRGAQAFFLEKSPTALAAMLGAVYAGCFYTVIDVRQSQNRVQSICEKLSPRFIFTDSENEEHAREIFKDSSWELINIEACFSGEVDEALLAYIRSQATDLDPLYVSFTSGSTGTPKGVVTSHRAVIDWIDSFTSCFNESEDDIHGNQAPFDFDASVKDIYSSLKVGSRVQIIPRSYFTAPATLMDYLAENKVTTLVWAVSAMTFVSIMNGFEYRVPSSIKRVLFSGEVMPPKQLRIWQENLPEAMFVNLYGPTETTCNCSYFIVDRPYENNEVIPAGKAFPNERIFLLDENDQLVEEPGAQGEVCVVGTTLASGYLNDPEKTAEVFVQNPLETRIPETMYRTGDIAYYNEDGNLVYLTRKDNQIKHLGQRIELGDIEATANGVEGVAQSCCLYDSRRKRIVLFYVGELEKQELAEALRSLLPQYMVPNSITKLEQLPLNKNGKTDRTQLAEQAGIK